MHFHVLGKDGHREEVSALEYLKAPICKRSKFMESLKQIREDAELKRAELRENARQGLRLIRKDPAHE